MLDYQQINPTAGQEQTEEEENQSLDQMTSKGLTNRECVPKVLLQIKLNPEVQPRDWTDAEKIIEVQKLMKDLHLVWTQKCSVEKNHGKK
ncbi:hypothetical protein O181_129424 [Austropuccinia psidii MF-1]|uniref:Uncharacterized protein n=1 Tax=Austropuccinia psidii MF-1 TaxID=1389203 RepID=A0A9Q3KZ14_9BASI|nr:hypothetical protein [Austropuccinia psidii MF-1]